MMMELCQSAPLLGGAGPGTPSILVIEDDVNLRAGLAMLLDFWGARVLECSSLRKAEPLLQEAGVRIDLIISDLQLQGSSCSETLAAITQLTARFGFACPVIVITGDSSPECRQQVTTVGWPRLLKPFTPDALRATIVDAIRA